MGTILKLTAAAIMPIIASALLYTAEKNTRFGKIGYHKKQIIIGIIFGIIAIFGTELGINVGGATLNVRNSAPLCAGLIFGAPSGIIAGLIGGVERYFATFWGAGEYTRLACSVSTVIAGLFGAATRHFMFDDKKPSCMYGLAAGVIVEIIDMLMIFLLNMSDVHRAFSFVELCAIPMVLVNGITVMLAIFVVSIIGKEKFRIRNELKRISQTFQKWLLLCVTVAFAITCVFIFLLQTEVSDNNTDSLLQLNIEDVRDEISDASDTNLLSLTYKIEKEITESGRKDNEFLVSLAEKYDVAEINIISDKGINIATTHNGFLNYNMADGVQSSEFLVLLKDEKEYVQSYQPTSNDPDISRKYAGVVLPQGGFVQVGYDSENFQDDIAEQVTDITKHRRIGEEGSIIIADDDNIIVSDSHGYDGKSLEETGLSLDTELMTQNQRFIADVYGKKSYCLYMTSEGYSMIAVLPVSEANFLRDMTVYVTVFMELLIFAALFILIYILIKVLIVENIHKINKALAQITNGNLDVVVDVRTNEEFSSLSDDINSTVETLKHYIDEAAARIDEELEFAKTIQTSALPSVFPPYPNRDEFEIWAEMTPAKEVGGDFYDFYLIGENRLAFIIADVSGKGIPAAMFMMTAKTLIKSLAETGLEVDEIFTRANEKLCENNDAGMFVTAWMGILDLNTGIVTFANAGHNPPILRHSDGSTEYIKARSGFILAGMEGTRYRKNELQLNKGDALYLYTDGVTEAADANEMMYGEERLNKLLSELSNVGAEKICKSVKRDVDRFVNGAAQSDDMTMLCLELKNTMQSEEAKVNELTVAAVPENIEKVTAFVEEQLENTDCPQKTKTQINVAVDEILGNIVQYAYKNEVGSDTVRAEVTSDKVVLTFIDSGERYNPLESKDPDITLPAEEREIGGLGIYIVKQTMDEVTYEYKDGKNVLKIKKNFHKD